MNIQRFLERAAEVLEIDQASEETVLRDCDSWDSLTALSLVAMVEKEFGTTLSGEDLRQAITVGELWRTIEPRMRK